MVRQNHSWTDPEKKIEMKKKKKPKISHWPGANRKPSGNCISTENFSENVNVMSWKLSGKTPAGSPVSSV